jgi:hypothetical protein
VTRAGLRPSPERHPHAQPGAEVDARGSRVSSDGGSQERWYKNAVSTRYRWRTLRPRWRSDRPARGRATPALRRVARGGLRLLLPLKRLADARPRLRHVQLLRGARGARAPGARAGCCGSWSTSRCITPRSIIRGSGRRARTRIRATGTSTSGCESFRRSTNGPSRWSSATTIAGAGATTSVPERTTCITLGPRSGSEPRGPAVRDELQRVGRCHPSGAERWVAAGDGPDRERRCSRCVSVLIQLRLRERVARRSWPMSTAASSSATQLNRVPPAPASPERASVSLACQRRLLGTMRSSARARDPRPPGSRIRGKQR